MVEMVMKLGFSGISSNLNSRSNSRSFWGFMVLGQILGWGSAIPYGDAQVIPDRLGAGGVGTIVDCGGGRCEITGGTAVQGNLFHSFSEFSIGRNLGIEAAIFTGLAIDFDYPIDRILVRVTGNNLSAIDGLIQTGGSLRNADFFLLNPRGIQFGSGSRLDLGGSFFATTGDRFQFTSGFFSAVGDRESLPPPLLSINQPVGVWLGNNPGTIAVVGAGHQLAAQDPIAQLFLGNLPQSFLAVDTGRSLTLLGGEIQLKGGALLAPQGQLQLGSAAGGFVGVENQDVATPFRLDYGQIQQFLPLSLTQQAIGEVSSPIPQLGGIRSGSITIQGESLTLADGSLLLGQNFGFLPGGDIRVTLTGDLTVTGTVPSSQGVSKTGIFNHSVVGDGGAIVVQSNAVKVNEGAALAAITFGAGQGGNLSIQTNFLQLDGVSPQNPLANSAIAAFTLGAGDAGDLSLSVEDLEILAGGVLLSTTFGAGDGGDIDLKATGSVLVSGFDPLSKVSSSITPSAFRSGNAGNVTVITPKLRLLNGGQISAATFDLGNAGNVLIQSGEIRLEGTTANAENQTVLAADGGILPLTSQARFGVTSPQGRSGDLRIETKTLSVSQNAFISANNLGSGAGGTLEIFADHIFLTNQGRITAETRSGEGGNIQLQANQGIFLRQGSQITTEAGRSGNGGNLSLRTPLLVAVPSENSDIVANAVQGNGGNITIVAQGVLGTEFRSQRTAASDITASSQFGLSGVVQLSQIENTLSSGLVDLPRNPIDPSQQVQNQCLAATENRFTLIGRGGIPEDPFSPLQSASFSELSNPQVWQVDPIATNPIEINPIATNPIEANHWQRNDRGEVVLQSKPKNNSPSSFQRDLLAFVPLLQTWRREGQYDRAIKSLEAIVAVPTLPQHRGAAVQDVFQSAPALVQAIVWQELGVLYSLTGNWELANTALNTSLTLSDPFTAEVSLTLSQAPIQTLGQPVAQKDLPRSEDSLANTIASGSWLALGNLARSQQLYDFALGFYQRSAQLVLPIVRPKTERPKTELPKTGTDSVSQGVEVRDPLYQEIRGRFSPEFDSPKFDSFDSPPPTSDRFNDRTSALLHLQAQVNQINLWLELGQTEAAQALLPEVFAVVLAGLHSPPLAHSTLDRSWLYTALNLSKSLEKLSVLPPAPLTQNQLSTTATTYPILRSELLAQTLTQAQQQQDDRAIVHSLQQLAEWHLTQGDRQLAQAFSEQALYHAQQLQSPDLIAATAPFLGERYAQDFQDSQDAQNDRLVDAVQVYQLAFTALQSLRQDLLTVNTDLQFDVRDQVEPIYRRFIQLLLTANHDPVPQENLKKALAVIEALQLAELDNFFGDTCLQTQPQNIAQLDRHAAVIYPIILNDRLVVITALPDQALKLHSYNLSRTQINQTLQILYSSLNPGYPRTQHLDLAQEVYRWIVEPLEAELQAADIQTLVFVPDSLFRNIPLSILHDGTQYIIDRYNIVLSPGLQLLPPDRALPQPQLLTAALTEARQGFSALPGVQAEITRLESLFPRATTLFNETFTTQALQEQVKKRQPSILHLATHGQFSGQAEDTFLLTWDGSIGIKELGQLLQPAQLGLTHSMDLLVMSACQTAKGDDRASLGLAGFALRSGARSTIATLWSVNDQSTAQLMTQLYQSLSDRDPLPKAEALRQAQRSLLHNPQTSHPYFWAGFVLVGHWL